MCKSLHKKISLIACAKFWTPVFVLVKLQVEPWICFDFEIIEQCNL